MKRKRKRKRAVRVYTGMAGGYWVFGRGFPEYWLFGRTWLKASLTEAYLLKYERPRLTGPALAAWLREHPKPKGK
jgi:hypothetical protein